MKLDSWRAVERGRAPACTRQAMKPRSSAREVFMMRCRARQASVQARSSPRGRRRGYWRRGPFSIHTASRKRDGRIGGFGRRGVRGNCGGKFGQGLKTPKMAQAQYGDSVSGLGVIRPSQLRASINIKRTSSHRARTPFADIHHERRPKMRPFGFGRSPRGSLARRVRPLRLDRICRSRVERGLHGSPAGRAPPPTRRAGRARALLNWRGCV